MARETERITEKREVERTRTVRQAVKKSRKRIHLHLPVPRRPGFRQRPLIGVTRTPVV
jgi:hypothetical protein